jgi:RimJ/RimL family protein N-acetyltransferase
MKLKNKLVFSHSLGECTFRTITSEDVSDNYINGLKEELKFIENIPELINRSSQANYIMNIVNSEKDTICGLFLNSELIGTAGIQNIMEGNRVSIGILLFNKKLRGHGFGKVLIWASCFLANNCRSTISFFAGMSKENLPSLKAFLACGFSIESELPEKYIVSLDNQVLKAPVNITHIRIS